MGISPHAPDGCNRGTLKRVHTDHRRYDTLGTTRKMCWQGIYTSCDKSKEIKGARRGDTLDGHSGVQVLLLTPSTIKLP